MSKHTPGPWFIDEDTLTIRSNAWEASNQMGDYRGCIVADLKPALGATDQDDLSICRPHARAETDANARLIAAAPELLAACERIVKGECTCADGGKGFVCDVCEAKAAVAKAKGT